MIIKKKMGPKGQLLIPKHLREYLKLYPVEEIILEVREDEIAIRRDSSTEDFLKDFIASPKKLTKNINIKHLLLQQYSESG